MGPQELRDEVLAAVQLYGETIGVSRETLYELFDEGLKKRVAQALRILEKWGYIEWNVHRELCYPCEVVIAEIEKGIPLAQVKRPRTISLSTRVFIDIPIAQMEVGDSFFFPMLPGRGDEEQQLHLLRGRVNSRRLSLSKGDVRGAELRFSSRKWGDGFRVWRRK